MQACWSLHCATILVLSADAFFFLADIPDRRLVYDAISLRCGLAGVRRLGRVVGWLLVDASDGI